MPRFPSLTLSEYTDYLTSWRLYRPAQASGKWEVESPCWLSVPSTRSLGVHTAPRETQRHLGKKIKIYLSTQRSRSGQLTLGYRVACDDFSRLYLSVCERCFLPKPFMYFWFLTTRYLPDSVPCCSTELQEGISGITGIISATAVSGLNQRLGCFWNVTLGV